MVMNSQVDKLHKQIAQLQKKMCLTNSQDLIQTYMDQIAELKEEIRKINRKKPKVVQVKDAATVGDKIEARLSGRARSSRMSDRAVMI